MLEGSSLRARQIGKVVGDRCVQLRDLIRLGDFDAPALERRQPCLRLRPAARLQCPALALALVIKAIQPYRALALNMAHTLGREAATVFYGTLGVVARI
jgi:hypothetical protein